jgi:hypothetical protein
MIAMIKEKPNFRGKFKKKSFCQWLQLPKKTYIIESNDDSDSDSDSDYDNGELINGNKPVLRIIHRRRPGIFQLFKI